MQIPLTSALLGALASLATAAASPNQQQQTTVTLWIPSSQQLPSPQILPSTTHATLTSLRNLFDAPLTAAGSFVFRNVTAGSYLADVHCGTHGFAPLRVDVLPSESGAGEKGGKAGEQMVVKAWETYRGNDWENKGQEVARSGGEHARFAVRALGPKEYFVERGSCAFPSSTVISFTCSLSGPVVQRP